MKFATSSVILWVIRMRFWLLRPESNSPKQALRVGDYTDCKSFLYGGMFLCAGIMLASTSGRATAQEVVSLENEIRRRIDASGFTECIKLANDPKPCFTMSFPRIYPEKTYVDKKRIVNSGIPQAIFFQQYRVKNCSHHDVPINDRIDTKYSERTEVSFEKQIQNQNNVSGGFEASLFDVVKVSANASSTYSVSETNRKTNSTEREVSSGHAFQFNVSPRTELLYTYQIAETKDYYSFVVRFVVDGDINYTRGRIKGTDKISNVLYPEGARTISISGTVRNVTGGRADIAQSEAPAKNCRGEEIVVTRPKERIGVSSSRKR